MTSTWDSMRPAAADTLRSMQDALVAAWERHVSRLVPSLASLARSACVDPIRELFAYAASALAAGPLAIPDVVAAHARARTTAGFGIEVIAREYGCLFDVLHDALFAIVPPAIVQESLAALDRMLHDWQHAAIVTASRELDLARERLIAILAHDLRTPLACVTMAAEMLALDRQRDDLPAQILSASERMERMVADVLDLARRHLGQDLAVAAKPDDLGEICRGALAELSIAYPERAIMLDATGDLRGHFDGDRVAQAISNLVRNAIEHGFGTVHVRAAEDRDGRMLVVEVTNMRAANASGPLPALSRRADGRLGFGLYIVHKIVAAHGGTCTHETTPVKTIYSLRWPRIKDASLPGRDGCSLST